MEKLSMHEMHECVGGLQLITGLNNLSNGVKVIQAPTAAIPGALNAFSHVLANVGNIDNIAVNPFA